METFSALLAICAGNSPVPGEFPTQRPVTRSFDVFFDLRLNKRLSKQSWGWWLETLSRPLLRHRNGLWRHSHNVKHPWMKGVCLSFSQQSIRDDAMIWKRFLHHWPFVRGIHRWPLWFPNKWPVMWSFDYSTTVSQNKSLNKRSSLGWFETPCGSRDGIMMWSMNSSYKVNLCIYDLFHGIHNCTPLLTSRFLYSISSILTSVKCLETNHDDVIKWKHFPRYWPFVRGIHRSPVNSQHKGQWRGALMFSLICACINGWVSNREAGDLRRYRAHYDVIVMG